MAGIILANPPRLRDGNASSPVRAVVRTPKAGAKRVPGRGDALGASEERYAEVTGRRKLKTDTRHRVCYAFDRVYIMPQDNGDILLDVCFQVHYEIVGLNTSRALAPAMAPSLWMTSPVLAGSVLTSMNALAATA